VRDRLENTWPRFDPLAQHPRAATPLALGDPSRRMMVTNANVPRLGERLVPAGVLSRRRAHDDPRSHVVRLTEKGRRQFRRMAAAHEAWIAELFAGLSSNDVDQLLKLLAKAKASTRRAVGKRP
jgi:DNA-binding MarR family transcriptional regulator